MKTEKLIDQIVSDNKPVKVLGARRVFCIFEAICVLLALLFLALFFGGMSLDLIIEQIDRFFLLETFTLLLTMFFSLYAAFILSVPGEDRGFRTLAIPSVALLSWVTILVFRAFSESESFNWVPGVACATEIVALSFIPAFIVIFIVRKGAALKLGWTGFFSFLSVAATVSLALQFTCHDRSVMHILMWHVVPVFLIAIVGAFLARRFLRW